MTAVEREMRRTLQRSICDEEELYANLDLQDSYKMVEEKTKLSKISQFRSTIRKSLARKTLAEIQQYENEEKRKRVDKLFEIPLIVSIMMLAMAHGSNEINVSAPLLAEIFFLDGQTKTVLNT